MYVCHVERKPPPPTLLSRVAACVWVWVCACPVSGVSRPSVSLDSCVARTFSLFGKGSNVCWFATNTLCFCFIMSQNSF